MFMCVHLFVVIALALVVVVLLFSPCELLARASQ